MANRITESGVDTPSLFTTSAAIFLVGDRGQQDIMFVYSWWIAGFVVSEIDVNVIIR